ncbi:hypothetical protein BJX76DRAFT_363310 [Aspergillus varians]
MADKTELTHDDYTVAWICALPLEMAAAKVMLDETHNPLYQPSTDHNAYTLGRRAGHNVVIACLPSGIYGTTSAATVLSHMLPTFPSLRFGLMVGIGGGVPRTDVDIRLGDVVVSMPNASSGGVVQYDYGKTLHDGRLQRTGSLNKPPQFLLTVISQMRSDHMIGKLPITDILADTFRKERGMSEQFSRPDKDWLFESAYNHQSGPDCSNCDQAQLVKRVPRENGDPHFHYGLIASGNQVIKDSTSRDSLAQEMDILCFEMEAAGLLDQLPCLVIRGICDYCDSHKNKQWQGYAALAAAAYAHALLERVPTLDRKADVKAQDTTERYWMVPFQRNSGFVGREDEIAKIEGLIAASSSKIAICGLGGVGKTQIALEVANRMRERDFDSIFWIQCTSQESVEQAYMSIAQMLGIHGVKATEAKSKVKAQLSQKKAGKWLLIFDNADSMDMWSLSAESKSVSLTDYLPQHEQGRILFTTRNRKLAVMLASSHVIHVSEPDAEAAVRILEKLLIEKDLLDNGGTTVALQLLEQLAFLPLAITQAAAYINENSIDFSDYIALLQEQEADVIELLSEDFGDDWRYQDIQNPKKITGAIGLLKAFSFISEQSGNLSLHRLVHLSTRNWLRKHQQFDQQISTTATRFERVFPTEDHANRKLWRVYLPHVLVLIGEIGFQVEQHLGLVRRVAKCLRTDGRRTETALLLEQILRIQKKMYGETDFKTIQAISDLADAYRDLEWLEEAENLEIQLGKWKETEEIMVQLLELNRRVQGPEHPNTMLSMQNLAFTYSEVGKPDEAENLTLQALDAHKRLRGPEHPDTLSSMSSLALIYLNIGRYEDAKELEEQTLHIRRRVLGPEHPDTLTSINMLTRTYWRLSQWDKAESNQTQLLEIHKRVLGPEHPYTLDAMKLLALRKQTSPNRSIQSQYQKKPSKTPHLTSQRKSLIQNILPSQTIVPQ